MTEEGVQVQFYRLSIRARDSSTAHLFSAFKNKMGDSGTSTQIGERISWTVVLEEYFAQTGEKANGLAIMHKKSESIFARRKVYIDLPVIVGSGAVAFLNAG
jgi:hypothetical protein